MRKCINKKYNISCNMKYTYEESWNYVLSSSKSSLNSFLYDNKKNQKDKYFENIPIIQDLLTDKLMISKNEIEFSYYIQIDPYKVNGKNLFECFHGILFYIYYYSNNKFNTTELEFHYSGAKNRKCLSSLINKNINNIDFYDIINIFNYENINNQFSIDCTINAFFGVSFKRIKVNPIAYSIRSGSLNKSNGNLISFTFEGYNEERQEWEVLDEQENITDLNRDGGYKLFYVHTTHKYFSSFKIQQTQPNSNDFWGFSISGFDIHGSIKLRENSHPQNENLYDESSSNRIYENEYDPIIDITNFL